MSASAKVLAAIKESEKSGSLMASATSELNLDMEASVETVLEALLQEREQRKQEIADLTASNERANRDNEKRANQLKAMAERIDAQHQTLNKLKQSIPQQDEMQALGKRADEASEDALKSKTRVTELEKELKSLQGEMQTLKGAKQAISEQRASIQRELEKSNRDSASLKEKTKQLESHLKQREETLGQVQTMNGTLKVEKDTLEKKQTLLQEKQTKLITEKTGLEQVQVGLNAKLAALQKKEEEWQAEKKALESLVEKQRREKESLESANTKTITDLKREVNLGRAKLLELQKNLSKLKDDLLKTREIESNTRSLTINHLKEKQDLIEEIAQLNGVIAGQANLILDQQRGHQEQIKKYLNPNSSPAPLTLAYNALKGANALGNGQGQLSKLSESNPVQAKAAADQGPAKGQADQLQAKGQAQGQPTVSGEANTAANSSVGSSSSVASSSSMASNSAGISNGAPHANGSGASNGLGNTGGKNNTSPRKKKRN